MRILLTGARAPVTLDLARHFHRAGHQVFLADSVRFPIARPTRAVRRTYRVARPALAATRFVDDLLRIIDRERIDLVVPTCEEIFFIAAHRAALAGRAQVFAEPIERLAALHDKWRFTRQVIALEGNVKAPETHLLESAAELTAWKTGKSSAEWVFKPVYSRFAARTLISPTESELTGLIPTAADAWIAQRRVHGREYSTYGVANAGRLRAHASYSSRYRAGKGSGIYFDAHHDHRIRDFVERIVGQLGFTGQIGFDFIDASDGGLYVLECNPRATSGLHLLASQPLADAFSRSAGPLLLPDSTRPAMLAGIMVLFALPGALRAGRTLSLCRDMRQARDVLFAANDPLPALTAPLSLAEVILTACRTGKRLTAASTFDIEWNGEPL